ncbi:MAG: RNA methyltransferase [Planctomycetota bacterium]
MDPHEEPPARLRRAEAVLARRTARIVLVLEQPWNDDNVHAVLRTAESFGVQHVWAVRHAHGRRRVRRAVTRGSHDWLTVRTFESTEELLAGLRAEGCTIWASDLSPEAEPVDSPAMLSPVPQRLALVIGREVGGVGETLLRAADRRLYLPMRGFTESFNLSVATALFLQRLFDAEPGLVGAMEGDERRQLRKLWYARLGGSDERKRERYLEHLEDPPPPLEDPRPRDEHRRPRIKKRLLRERDEER